MEIILIFTGAFIAGLSGALMPGPMLALTIAQSVKKGFWSGPLTVLGHMILELVLVTGLLLGFKKFLAQPHIIKIIFITGGIILIAMGADMFARSRKAKIAPAKDMNEDKFLLNPVANGILVSLSNPYWTIWWATIGLGYLIKAVKYGIIGISAFFAGHILSDLIWYSAVSFAFSRGAVFMSERVYHMIIYVCGIFLLLFGAWFIYSGI